MWKQKTLARFLVHSLPLSRALLLSLSRAHSLFPPPKMHCRGDPFMYEKRPIKESLIHENRPTYPYETKRDLYIYIWKETHIHTKRDRRRLRRSQYGDSGTMLHERDWDRSSPTVYRYYACIEGGRKSPESQFDMTFCYSHVKHMTWLVENVFRYYACREGGRGRKWSEYSTSAAESSGEIHMSVYIYSPRNRQAKSICLYIYTRWGIVRILEETVWLIHMCVITHDCFTCVKWHDSFTCMTQCGKYGVATISGLLKIICLFCRISSLL